MMEPLRILWFLTLLLFFIVIATEEDKLFHSAYFRHENKFLQGRYFQDLTPFI